MKQLVAVFALGLIGLGLIIVAGCSAPAAVANPALAEAAAATAAPEGTPAPTDTPQPPEAGQTIITATAALSPCVLTPIVVPTMPAQNPGYAMPDPATDGRLHITGQATEIDLATYRLKVTGLVDRPLELTYDELRCMPKTSVHCTLVCPGFFEDVATWTGVPLAHLLDLAGVQPGANGVKLVSADGYRIQVSLSAARQPGAILAYQWEDEPVPVLHGFPLRAVFPELQGNHWVKWLVEVQVVGEDRSEPASDAPATAEKPPYVTSLEAVYGASSQAGFGSAVFVEAIDPAKSLEQVALEYYRHFVCDLWARYGEDAWMGPWKQVYARQAGSTRDIVVELRGITDPDARQSVPMVLDVVENAEVGRQALSAAYDDPAVVELTVYTLGDGGAMSGLLIAGRRDTGEATFLVFLMD